MIPHIPSNIAGLCIEDIRAKLASLPALNGKIVFVYDEADLDSKTLAIKSYPACGIVYEGIRAANEAGYTKQGISGLLQVMIVITVSNEHLIVRDTKSATVQLLDDIRGKIMCTRSPSNHFWQFIVEASAAQKNGKVLWVQRWQTPVQLVQRS